MSPSEWVTLAGASVLASAIACGHVAKDGLTLDGSDSLDKQEQIHVFYGYFMGV